MKEWSVELPVVARVFVVVEADDEEGAIRRALENVPRLEFEKDNPLRYSLEEAEALRHVVRGNVCYASPSEASAEEYQ